MRNLLLVALMWSCPIEILNVSKQDTMQLLLTDDQYVIQALSPNTPQETLTDRVGSWRMIGSFEHLETACSCNTSETGSKLAIIIANEILGDLSIRSRLPQWLCGPRVGRKSCYTDMDHFARFELDDEERKERAEQEVSHLEEIASPHFSCIIAEKGSPVLSP